MNTKIQRFFTFIQKEKTRNFFAFTFYILVIIMCIEIDLPSTLKIICFVTMLIIILFSCTVYLSDWLDIMYEKNSGKIGKNIIQEIKKLAKEILMFIPVFIISIYLIDFLFDGQPANQTSLENSFYEAPIFNSIYAIIIAPIVEEFIFRFLPYKFIKNKTLYVIISTVIFAGIHVVHDPNAFYYIWFYMIRPLYYGYRYHKTKDLLVPISMHSLNNLVSTLVFVFS